MFGKAPGMPVIRPAKIDDVAALKYCAEAAYEKYVIRMGKKPAPMVADFSALVEQKTVHVLDVDNKVCGFIVCYVRHDHFYIENIAVDPAHHGQGYGKQLMDFAEVQTRARGFSRLELYTNEKMWENLKLYPRLGYTEFARISQDGFNRVFFYKNL